tara:strand:+ start:220 stop:465 length:246 start_codon:yes stop_codon:yes gene_type:complete
MLTIAPAPPGCPEIHAVRSYALPEIAAQQLEVELFFAMFAIEYSDSTGSGSGSGAGDGSWVSTGSAFWVAGGALVAEGCTD